jgi:ATP-dependent Lhr-like helicase
MKQQPVPFDHKRDLTGRWSALDTAPQITRDAALDVSARVLLERYGVMFRRLLTRETNAPSWRELTRVYRRLEARGGIRGGRFVTGVSGEQFALPEAVERLREARRSAPTGRLVTISAADPLNLTGILAGDDRVRAVTSTRIVYRDGVALAALEGEYLRPLGQVEPTLVADVASAAAGRRMPAVSSGFVGR